jgi:hypothetical protein
MVSPAAAVFGALPIPPEYPVEQHARLHQAAIAFFGRESVPSALQDEFRSAWNAVVYRYVACLESAEAFARSVERHGDAPAHPERYAQERDFFNFVVNGMACIEALHYGIFAWCSSRALTGFDLANERDRRAVNPATALDRLRDVPDASAVASALGTLLASATYYVWGNLRRILFHRGLPGRLISVVIGGGSGSATRYHRFGESEGPEVTPETSRQMSRWLTDQLRLVLPLAQEWVSASSTLPGTSSQT